MPMIVALAELFAKALLELGLDVLEDRRIERRRAVAEAAHRAAQERARAAR